jgi:MFS family permease
MNNEPSTGRRFLHITCAGITFQGGSAAVDSATVIAALVHQLTGSAIAVGAVTTVLRIGWLAPQIVVGYLAQRRQSSLLYFIFGAFGRASCLALLACLLAFSEALSTTSVTIGYFIMWTAYSFISGIVAVPYNDIVGRSVPSKQRSRLLALRFFGGGILALGIAAIADRLVVALLFPASYAAVIGMASILMYISSVLFAWPGEPPGRPAAPRGGFGAYLKDGLTIFREEITFRRFVFAQWSGAAAMMALPFYVVAADAAGFDIARVGLLLGAQTLGSLAANPLWGWWGDRHGKRSLLWGVALLRILPPIAILFVLEATWLRSGALNGVVVVAFFALGALSSGVTIGVLGLLMELSPDNQRAAYSGYFNALTAPAYLLPLLAGIVVALVGAEAIFVLAALGAFLQILFVSSIPTVTQPR